MAHPNAVRLMIVDTLCNTPKLLFNCSIALECGPGSEYFLPSRVSKSRPSVLFVIMGFLRRGSSPRALMVTLLHGLSCGRTNYQSVKNTGNKDGCKRYEDRPSITVREKTTEANVFSEGLVSDTKQFLTRVGEQECQTEDRLEGKEDRESGLLKSRELGSRKDLECNNTTDERLEECGSEEGPIAQDVIRFVVGNRRHIGCEDV